MGRLGSEVWFSTLVPVFQIFALTAGGCPRWGGESLVGRGIIWAEEHPRGEMSNTVTKSASYSTAFVGYTLYRPCDLDFRL